LAAILVLPSHPKYDIWRTVQRIPGGQNVQVFVGTSILLGLCAIPVFAKDTKAGHDLFSQEKPQAIVSESKLRREYIDAKKEQRQQE
jgi:hypothetical protein